MLGGCLVPGGMLKGGIWCLEGCPVLKEGYLILGGCLLLGEILEEGIWCLKGCSVLKGGCLLLGGDVQCWERMLDVKGMLSAGEGCLTLKGCSALEGGYLILGGCLLLGGILDGGIWCWGRMLGAGEGCSVLWGMLSAGEGCSALNGG